MGLQCDYVNTCCLEDIEKAITPHTKAIFIETPTNPLMQQTDISAVAALAKRFDLLLIVDNTFTRLLFNNPSCLERIL